MLQVPSWSWASSLKQVEYHWILWKSSFWGDLEKIASLVIYQDPKLGLRKLDVGERWIDEEMPIESFKYDHHVPPLSGKYVPGEVRSNMTWRECPHNPWETLTHAFEYPPGTRGKLLRITNTTISRE
jgi:hypothetical protein